MGIESATYISDLNEAWPLGSDLKSTLDNHHRLTKAAIKTTFPNVTGAVTPTHMELNFVDGVTSAIQTQIDAKFDKAGGAITGDATISGTLGVTGAFSGTTGAFSGAVTGATATAGDNSTKFATTAYVQSTAFSSALPSQTGNADKFTTTDGSTPSWTDSLKATVMRWVDGSDTTKKLAFGLSGITTGTTRTITIPDSSGTLITDASLHAATSKATPVDADEVGLIDSAASNVLKRLTWANLKATLKTYFDTLYAPQGGGGWTYLSTVTASAASTVDVETTFSSTYDAYVIVGSGVVPSVDGSTLGSRLKVSGAYDTGSNYRWTVTTNGANSTSFVSEVSTSATFINVLSFFDGSSGAHGNFTMQVYNPASTSLQKMVTWQGAGLEATARVKHNVGSGFNTGTGAVTGVRFYLTGGGTITGKFRLYGIVNS